MNQPTLGFVVIALAVLAAVAIFLRTLFKRRRSKRLRGRFGPEYDRAVIKMQSRGRAEAQLAKREKRVDKLPLRPLSAADVQRFAAAWKGLQNRFVDKPKVVAVEADHLLREVMRARGYFVADFDELAADVSVDHPMLVEDYRRAHAIAWRRERGEATTEELRQAIVFYRSLFEDLLQSRQVA